MGKKSERSTIYDRLFDVEARAQAQAKVLVQAKVLAKVVDGGTGADTLTGTSAADTISGNAGNDVIFGASGNDILNGGAGADQLIGGSGDDVLTGGDGPDQMIGGAGKDQMIWNSGDDTDVMEGGADFDTAEVKGGSAGENFTVTANGLRIRLDRLTPDPFFLDIGSTERIVVRMNAGDDKFSAVGNLAALAELAVDGGDGNDTILGGNGADRLFGGNGNDFIDGQQGNDFVALGAGDDVFQWDPGDGSDVVNGDAGTDTMVFNGSNVNEIFDVSANGDHVRFTRNIANIVMDLNDLETIQVNALGGQDNISINNLAGTDAKLVAIDLAFNGAPDLAADVVTVHGTAGENVITLTSSDQLSIVNGLAAKVTVDHAETQDILSIDAGAGDDVIDATKHFGTSTLRLLGGAGDDFVTGSGAADIIGGGAGDDLLIGRGGNDTFILTSALDGHDVVTDFDGNATGGQDVVDLDALFDALGVAAADRAGRISLTDHGNSVTLNIDTGGPNLVSMTINTIDAVTIGEDILVGT